MFRHLPTIGVSALALSVAVPARAQSFFFDFNNQSDAGLTRYNPLAPFGTGGNWSFPLLSPGDYGYQPTQAGLPAGYQYGPARMGSSVTGYTFSDLFESVDVVNFDPSLGQAFGLGFRVINIGLGTTSGYALDYTTPAGKESSTGQFTFDRLTDEAATDIGTAANVTLQADHSYSIVLMTAGSNFTGELFDLSNPATPLATVTATDSTYTSGAAGVIAAAANLTPTSGINVTFDNLFVQVVPEPSSLVLMGLGLAASGLWATWSRRRPRRRSSPPAPE